jgi:hypothetical protein
MTTPAPTKIVIVSGQEFSVPSDTDNEAIREHLKGSGFPDVAAATIQTGTRTIDGALVQTIEFVKKAGTKGLSGAELAQLLSAVAPSAIERTPHGLDRAGAALIRHLIDGQLTIGQALANEDILMAALLKCESRSYEISNEGARLCERIDRVSAVPCAVPCAW